MTNPVLRRALDCAGHGWPVFPCLPGQKTPATRHGHHDATTDPAQVREWFTRHPELNLAVATGTPGPDVLDIDSRGPAATGFPALARLRTAGLLDAAGATVRTPSGGLHVYFTGSHQRTSHLPACHIDFLAAGGYVLIPPSHIDGRPYQHGRTLGGHGGLNWNTAARLLEPARYLSRTAAPQAAGQSADQKAAGEQAGALARWVAAQPEGNRNNGLFWAANRALDTDPATDLSPLAAAARQAGLAEPEITRTLNSARRTRQSHPESPSHQAEGNS